MDNKNKIGLIDVVRNEGDLVHVLGRQKQPWLQEKLYHTIHDINTGEIQSEETFRRAPYLYYLPLFPIIPGAVLDINFVAKQNILGFAITTIAMILPMIGSTAYINKKQFDSSPEYYSRVWEFEKANSRDLNEALSKIRFYQGTIDEVSKDLGKTLARVDTKKLNTFIRAQDDHDLRWQAYLLGADAVIHCQPGSSIGTPVRFSK